MPKCSFWRTRGRIFSTRKSWEGESQEISDPALCLRNRNPFFFPFYLPPSHYCPFVVSQHFEKTLTFIFSSLLAVQGNPDSLFPISSSPGPAAEPQCMSSWFAQGLHCCGSKQHNSLCLCMLAETPLPPWTHFPYVFIYKLQFTKCYNFGLFINSLETEKSSPRTCILVFMLIHPSVPLFSAFQHPSLE